MRAAQNLYEAGHITYMRTDSVHLSNDALADLRTQIEKEFGPEYVPGKPNFYKTKSKNAQEAHEAIRPTSAANLPAILKASLKEDQFRLYELIWRRSMASQMNPALVDTVAVEFDCDSDATFRANGSVIAFPGFLRAYEVSQPQGKEDKENSLPDLKEGDVVTLQQIRAEQHFTEPPPRYSEASLVKALEDFGIGRPSTYASIIQTLVRRKYVDLESRRFTPTNTGRVVSSFLESHFEPYVDYEFTARMEDTLDEISRGELHWIPPLMQFWKPFIKRIREKEETVSRQEAKMTRVLGVEPSTGKEVSVRLGRFGAHAQIGSVEDEEKPRFAGLRPGQKLDTITLEEALELFKLPRDLGSTPEGEEVSVGIGRFGPYIRYGSKFVSLKEDDPLTVKLPRALEVVAAKKQADIDRILKTFEGTDVQILKGRWGPFIANETKNARMPKDREPDSMTLEECLALLEAAPEKRGRKKAAKKKTAKKKTSRKKKAAKKKTSRKKTVKKKASKKKTSKKSAAIKPVAATASG
jgi:DNA topoisomerase-1